MATFGGTSSVGDMIARFDLESWAEDDCQGASWSENYGFMHFWKGIETTHSTAAKFNEPNVMSTSDGDTAERGVVLRIQKRLIGLCIWSGRRSSPTTPGVGST